MAWMRIVGRDLKDRDRLERAAAAVGLDVARGDDPPAVVVIDLDREDVPGDLPEGVPALGYFSHVDADVARRAEDAGVTAIRRGTFWADPAGVLKGAIEDL